MFEATTTIIETGGDCAEAFLDFDLASLSSDDIASLLSAGEISVPNCSESAISSDAGLGSYAGKIICNNVFSSIYILDEEIAASSRGPLKPAVELSSEPRTPTGTPPSSPSSQQELSPMEKLKQMLANRSAPSEEPSTSVEESKKRQRTDSDPPFEPVSSGNETSDSGEWATDDENKEFVVKKKARKSENTPPPSHLPPQTAPMQPTSIWHSGTLYGSLFQQQVRPPPPPPPSYSAVLAAHAYKNTAALAALNVKALLDSHRFRQQAPVSPPKISTPAAAVKPLLPQYPKTFVGATSGPRALTPLQSMHIRAEPGDGIYEQFADSPNKLKMPAGLDEEQKEFLKTEFADQLQRRCCASVSRAMMNKRGLQPSLVGSRMGQFLCQLSREEDAKENLAENSGAIRAAEASSWPIFKDRPVGPFRFKHAVSAVKSANCSNQRTPVPFPDSPPCASGAPGISSGKASVNSHVNAGPNLAPDDGYDRDWIKIDSFYPAWGCDEWGSLYIKDLFIWVS